MTYILKRAFWFFLLVHLFLLIGCGFCIDERLIPLNKGSIWIYDGVRISADLSETLRYRYEEEVFDVSFSERGIHYVIRSQSDEFESAPSFTLLNEIGNNIFISFELEGFGKFEILMLPGSIRRGLMWKTMEDTVFRWAEDELLYNVRFCGTGIVRGEEKVSTQLGRFKAIVVDNIYAQELVITDEKADTILWDNKEELHRFYLVPGIGIVKNIEIDAVGNKRIETITGYKK